MNSDIFERATKITEKVTGNDIQINSLHQLIIDQMNIIAELMKINRELTENMDRISSCNSAELP